ncbi:DNA-binding protein WhiA [Peptoniphilus sp. GNH]|nr:hypothetical protein HMPREF3189_00449 [Clostridiales bacterium KA00134]UHR02583.1 DNA-binding protein WhiA [Peptoniphilus sp. GNH]
MSFSNFVKNEAAKVKNEKTSTVEAELAGFIRMNSKISLTSKGPSIRFVTENASVARRMFTFIKRFYGENVTAFVSRNTSLKKNNNYNIVVDDYDVVKVLLYDTDFIRNDNYFMPNFDLPRELLNSIDCKKAYIRGSFLGAGSISNPEKSYHMEFVMKNELHAHGLELLLKDFGLRPGITERNDSYVLYLKEAEQISDLLALIDATKSVLDFENIRVLKDMRNHVNRLVNCETANLNKTVKASVRQREDILLIDKILGLKKLPQELFEVCELRLENMEASLKDLGSMLDPPLGRSGVNHRFKKIEEIANNLRSGE